MASVIATSMPWLSVTVALEVPRRRRRGSWWPSSAGRACRLRGHRWQHGQRERGPRLVGIDDDEAAAWRVLAPVDRRAAQLLDAVGGDHDGEVALVLDE